MRAPSWPAVAVIAILAACDDDAPTAPPVLTRTIAADAASCPGGGTSVLAGSDRDRDGVLDDGEVTSRTAVCAMAPVLVRVDDEPPGARCADGGAVVASGPDRDGDGGLDDDEVERVDLVCDDRLLTRLDDEAPGDRCIDGGIAFRTGRDRDGDGALGDDEVEDVEIECSDIVGRAIDVTSAADLALLSHVRAIHGALRIISVADITAIDLPRLAHVGELYVREAPALTRIALPALATIDDALSITMNPALAEMDVPALRRVGGRADLVASPLLTTNPLAAVRDVGGAITISGTGVTAIAIAVAGRAGNLAILDNARLERVEVHIEYPDARYGGISVIGNPALTEVDVDATMRWVEMLGNPVLTDVRITNRSDKANVTLRESPALTRVSLRGWGYVESGGSLIHVEGPVTSLDLGVGVQCHDLAVVGTRLTALDLSNVTAGHDLLVENNELLARVRVGRAAVLKVRGNPALVDLTYDQRSLGALELQGNAALASLAGLARLVHVEWAAFIENNPRLPACAVDALFARIDAPVENGSGNDDDGVCP
jgi:hypothetical protein